MFTVLHDIDAGTVLRNAQLTVGPVINCGLATAVQTNGLCGCPPLYYCGTIACYVVTTHFPHFARNEVGAAPAKHWNSRNPDEVPPPPPPPREHRSCMLLHSPCHHYTHLTTFVSHSSIYLFSDAATSHENNPSLSSFQQPLASTSHEHDTRSPTSCCASRCRPLSLTIQPIVPVSEVFCFLKYVTVLFVTV